MLKFIHEFKKGDIVNYYGGQFRITKDSRESQSHRPRSGHLIEAEGRQIVQLLRQSVLLAKCKGISSPARRGLFRATTMRASIG